MDINKANNYFFKLLQKGKPIYWNYEDDIDKVLISDGHIIVIMNRDDVLISTDKSKRIDDMYKKFIPDDNYYLETKLTDTILLDPIMDKLRILITSNDDTIYIQDRYISLFKVYELKAIAPDKPVLVYDNNSIIGMILPVKRY